MELTKPARSDVFENLYGGDCEFQQLFVRLKQGEAQRAIIENHVSVFVEDLEAVANFNPHVGNGLKDLL